MIFLPREGEKDVSVVLTGAAGQGIQTAEEVLGKVLKRSGFHIFATREFMSRVRGGNTHRDPRPFRRGEGL